MLLFWRKFDFPQEQRFHLNEVYVVALVTLHCKISTQIYAK